MNGEKALSRSRAIATKAIYAMFQVLDESGDQLPFREIIKRVEKRIALDDWAKCLYEKTGNVRWVSILHFYSIECVKAGFLVKQKGVWFLTKEGKNAIALGETGLLNTATQAYRSWSKQKEGVEAVEEEGFIESERFREVTLEEVEQIASSALQKFTNAKTAYEFQELVAALLRGMGYFTPFVAPLGKDGGIDIIAYRDPLGMVSPRIKVQVKHRKETADVKDVRQLMGLLQKDGDVGMFVSMSGFTPDAKAAAKGAQAHVELIDFERFISLWQEFYPKLSDEDKAKLPLRAVYFLAPE